MCVGKRKEDAKNETCIPAINIYGTVTCSVSLLLGEKKGVNRFTVCFYVFISRHPSFKTSQNRPM